MKAIFNQPWMRHTALILGIITLSQLGALILRIKATKEGNCILEPISHNSAIQRQGINTLSNLDKPSLRKLLNLFTTAENQKNKHKQAFLTFYPYHFASSTLLLIFTSISVVAIFLTAQAGLNNVNPYLKSAFLTLVAMTTFSALSPVVFKQEANISNNLSKYIHYDNLQLEIYNYAVTNPHSTSAGDTLSLNVFHSRIAKSITETNSINVEFDYKSIPKQDFGLKKE